MSKRILMFGWEFPPNNQGGLGTACEGLVKGLTAQGKEVILVLPEKQESSIPGLKIVSPHLKRISVNSLLQAYHTEESYSSSYKRNKGSLYGNNLFSEVERYAQAIEEVVREEEFDLIHAHDWLTYKAGLKAKQLSGKPLIVHVHATEFDRTGGNGINQFVYIIEKEGMEKADLVITVSNFTKNKVIEHYGIPAEKIRVVHNAVAFNDNQFRGEFNTFKREPLVLFLGRITLQKGPDYFLDTAKRILELRKNINFVMAGRGDMEEQMIEQAAALGLSDKFLFAGFLRGAEIDRMYQMADVYVMPSVSEPFGITPLEAMRNDVPVIISKQSGVSEVITHCLKVDFWDVDE
ncbi:MAG: glycosyltransferase family 4 protein, partial [Candidatus Woesearchaeota archaeon]